MSLRDLNEAQRRVASHLDGPLLVLAGPGSGKTHTIVARSVNLIRSHGVDPRRILMLTFSRKAAQEMRERATAALGGGAPVCLSFHAFGYRLMRRYGMGRGRDFAILDGDDQVRVMVDALGEAGVDENVRSEASSLLERWSLARDSGLRIGGGEEALLRAMPPGHGKIRSRDYLRAVNHYEEIKRRCALVDFDDLICLPVDTLGERADLADRLRDRFRYLVVDEFQDTSLVQLDLVRILGAHGNVVVVGDDDQCIYAWRGARADNVRRFRDLFGAEVVCLDRNYRSSPEIVEAAVRHISGNSERMDKIQAPRDGAPSGEVRHFHFPDERRQFEDIGGKILGLIRSGVSPGEIAVLYRLNRIGGALELVLRRMGIRCEVRGGFSILDRAEIRLFIAVARLATNRRDYPSLLRVSGYLPGVGGGTVRKLREHSLERDVSLVPPPLALKLSRAAADSLGRLARFLDRVAGVRPAELSGLLLSAGCPLEIREVFTRKDGRSGMLRRIDSLRSFARSCEGFRDWGEFMMLMLDGDDGVSDARSDRVVLSTIHKAKGLEWDHVFVPGVVYGVMPLVRDYVEDPGGAVPGDPEEERRLSYVALTRARRGCHLYSSSRLELSGRGDVRYFVSPFVREICPGREVVPELEVVA